MSTLPFDITGLNSVLGAYFRENSEEIITDLLYQPALNPEFNVWNIIDRVTIKDEKAWGLADFNPEVQDANLAFNAQSEIVTIDGRILKMRQMRSDFKIEPMRLYNSWLSHIATEGYHDGMSTGDLTVAMTAFGDWIIRNLVAKFYEKLYLQTSFLGAYTANFTGASAQSFNHAADGYATKIAAARTGAQIPAGQVVAVGSGSITNANAYDHFEALAEAMLEKFYYRNMFLVTSVSNGRNYDKGFKAAHPGANVNIHETYKRRTLQNSPKVSILPTPELGASDTSFIVPAGNMVFATDFDNAPPQLLTSVSDDPMVINCTLLYSCAFGFKREDLITANDL